ncbi:protein of unknown function [Roseomonas rosea]|uniref:DUF945 domain-containing protein n=2 Tax=Muricoccus roseus TaxID=198092 RepID=A0A1M6R2Z8_9PROT|nr:protein of unknown function [Roseomonas rosea]
MSFLRSSRSFGSTRAAMGASPLSDGELMQLAPSAFATEAHSSRSARYAYIPTADVIAGLRREGFAPVLARQTRPRDADRSGHTKHLIRFRHEGQAIQPRRVGMTFPEVVLINSHDGTSAYHVTAGVFRLACLNGMVVSDGPERSVKVPHKGDVVRQVIEGSFEVLDASRQAIEAADTWAGVTLNRDEQHALADAARVLRFGDEEGNVSTPIQADQLLRARRVADASDDLWTTFNRVQENTIRGGLQAWGRDGNNRPRRVTSREVTGIDQDVKLNRALWMLGERMAALKGAA